MALAGATKERRATLPYLNAAGFTRSLKCLEALLSLDFTTVRTLNGSWSWGLGFDSEYGSETISDFSSSRARLVSVSV